MMLQPLDYRAVQGQFGRQVEHYARSRSHSAAESLNVLVELARPQPADHALDVATGAGFTALALAPSVAGVLAIDITPAMVRQTARAALEAGLTNLRAEWAGAEDLPYPGASFTLVTCRLACHHFLDLERALSEMVRVCAPGGRVVLCDTVAPEEDSLDRWMNDVEKRRDPTHVRDCRPSEWRRLLQGGGLAELHERVVRTDLEFFDWIRRAGTPSEVADLLEQDFRAAPKAVSRHFAIRPGAEGVSFQWDTIVIAGTKPIV